jgi:putative transposase
MSRVTLHRAYKFRLYPTEAQEAELAEYERQLRWLWNLAHEQRLLAMQRPREERPRVDYFRQAREMTELLSVSDQLARVVCCARQEVLRHLDRAWQRFFKRLGGRPRFKSRTESVGIYFSTPKHWKVELGCLSLSGAASSLGGIRIRQDRPWPGDAKFSSCHIVRDVDQWYASFPLEYSVEQMKPKAGAVGLNRGAVHALADSYGRVVDSPAYYVKALKKIQKLSRELARKEKGSANRHKAAVKLARAHRAIRRQREWFLHDQSAYYAKRYTLIAYEDWSTKEMTSKEPDPKIEAPKNLLNRKILDVGWYELGRQLDYKAEATGGATRKVNPGLGDEKQPNGGISTVCSGCGATIQRASGHQDSLCENCHRSEVGDVNAARNVLLRAILNKQKETASKKKVTIKISGRKRTAA